MEHSDTEGNQSVLVSLPASGAQAKNALRSYMTYSTDLLHTALVCLVFSSYSVSYTHLRAHETEADL
eukprot:386197-Amphidinium_carterae.1